MGFNEKGPSSEKMEADYQEMIEQSTKQEERQSTRLNEEIQKQAETPEGYTSPSDLSLEQQQDIENITKIQKTKEKIKFNIVKNNVLEKTLQQRYDLINSMSA